MRKEYFHSIKGKNEKRQKGIPSESMKERQPSDPKCERLLKKEGASIFLGSPRRDF